MEHGCSRPQAAGPAQRRSRRHRPIPARETRRPVRLAIEKVVGAAYLYHLPILPRRHAVVDAIFACEGAAGSNVMRMPYLGRRVTRGWMTTGKLGTSRGV